METKIEEEEEESETTSNEIISTKCEICATNAHKYKCPGCSMKTCSLACCKQHKQSTGCDGQRDKTKFVNKEQFDEHVLLSDYKFLEEQSRQIDNYQRAMEQAMSGSIPANAEPSRQMPLGAYENLRKFVYSQFNMCLKLMPVQSTRRQCNKTRFNRAAGCVSWSVEFVFHLDQSLVGKKLEKTLFRLNTKAVLFSSKDTMRTILAQLNEKFKSALFLSSETGESSALVRTFGSVFKNESFEQDLNVLFEIKDYERKKRFFVGFEMDKSFEECLSNKTVIEYPTLYLVTKSCLGEYVIREDTVVVNNVDMEKSEENVQMENEEVNESSEGVEEEEEEEENEAENLNESKIKKLKIDDSETANSNILELGQKKNKNGDDESEEGEISDSDE
jgi:hypothetical protein